MSKIFKRGQSNSGVWCNEGYYAVHPEGHVVVVPEHAPLKDGWRHAEQHEIDGIKPEPKAAEPDALEPGWSEPIDEDPSE